MFCLVGQIRNIKPENPNNTTQISVKKPVKMKQKTRRVTSSSHSGAPIKEATRQKTFIFSVCVLSELLTGHFFFMFSQ